MIIKSNFYLKKQRRLSIKLFFLKKLKKLQIFYFFLNNISKFLIFLKKEFNFLNFLKKYFKKYIYIITLKNFFFYNLKPKNSLYIILNNKKKQIFLNILNNLKKNKNFLSTGICLKILGSKTKSMRRTTKGFLVLINFLKKILLKNKNLFLNFNIISSKKYSLVLLKELAAFLKIIKKNSAIFF